MGHVEEYDLVILGSGEASKFLAWALANEGKRVAVIERRFIGGSCPNIACLPSKNLIHSAKIASHFRQAEEFGFPAVAEPVQMTVVQQRKRTMIDGLIDFHLGTFQSTGAELVLGQGRFVAPKTIEITLNEGGTRTLRGHTVVIGTGSRARLDETAGLLEAGPMTHIEALDLDHAPGHLIVLGGGYVGLELAQAFRRLGSRVTIIDRNASLIHREDADVTAAMGVLFQDEGIEVLTRCTVKHVDGKSGDSIRLRLNGAGSDAMIEGTHLLVAGGRIPNTNGIGLDLAGVELAPSGHVRVNERLQTTASGVWAAGDCAGSPQFTHIGYDDFRVIRDNLAGHHRVTTGRQVPFCLFTDPELARVGLTEREAVQQGIPYRLAKIPMLAVMRTRTLGETRGFMKALIADDSDRILGFTAFGAGVGDLLAPVQIAMAAGLPYTTFANSILTHPTMSEGLVSLFSSVPGH